MVEAGVAGDVITAPFAAPTIDHVPVPTVGVFAASVNDPEAQFD
jgi:hypothetical protein